MQRAFDGFRNNGFQPKQVVTVTTVSLDGLEASVRNHRTTLTYLITQGMLNATNQEAELAIVNSGYIRIDDVLPPGEVTQYDVIRIMPFEGQVMLVEMSGALLEKVLNQGIANKGTGGYLQTANVSQDEPGNWLIGNNALNLEQVYKVAINDFLLTGKENGLDYLNLENPEIKLLAQEGDIRFALINQLQKAYGD